MNCSALLFVILRRDPGIQSSVPILKLYGFLILLAFISSSTGTSNLPDIEYRVSPGSTQYTATQTYLDIKSPFLFYIYYLKEIGFVIEYYKFERKRFEH